MTRPKNVFITNGMINIKMIFLTDISRDSYILNRILINGIDRNCERMTLYKISQNLLRSGQTDILRNETGREKPKILPILIVS